MYPEQQQNQQEQPNNLARQQQTTIRVIGAFIGRVLSTIGVGVAVRNYRQNQLAEQEHENPENLTGFRWLLNQFKEEGIVAGATVLTWNSKAGGETGANVSEYLLERFNNMANQNYAVLPPYAAPRTSVVADRFTDSLLMRFANYAANSFPETNTVGASSTPQQRFDIPRFF